MPAELPTVRNPRAFAYLAAAIGNPIPANVATREILQFIELDPNTKNWSDQAKQDLLSTILIGFLKSKHIGLWERGK